MKTKQGCKEAHVYVPDAVFKELKKLAELNRRSMSAEIVIAIERRIEECKKRGQQL